MDPRALLVAAFLASTALAGEPPAPEAAPPAAPALPDAAALAVAPPPPSPSPVTMGRMSDLATFVAADAALRDRAATADRLQVGSRISGVVAAVALVAVPFAAVYDLADAFGGRTRRPPRFALALGVSLGAGGLFFGLDAAAHREAAVVAQAWNAAHPERPLDWRP